MEDQSQPGDLVAHVPPNTTLSIQKPGNDTSLWPEPLTTPGVIPRHLKKSATAAFPILEVLQRLLYRLRPQGTSGSDLEKALALIGLYQAVRPVYSHIKKLFLWAFTVQITVPESDPVSKEILGWMGSEIVSKSRTRSAMLLTGSIDNMNGPFPHQMRFPGTGPGNDRVDDEVLCLPPLGTRIFWYVRFYLYYCINQESKALSIT